MIIRVTSKWLADILIKKLEGVFMLHPFYCFGAFCFLFSDLMSLLSISQYTSFVLVLGLACVFVSPTIFSTAKGGSTHQQ